MNTSGPNEQPPAPRTPPPPSTVAERAAEALARQKEVSRMVALGVVGALVAVVAGTVAAVVAYPTLSADDGPGITDGFGSLGSAYAILVGVAFATYVVFTAIGLVASVQAGRRSKAFLLLMIPTLPGPVFAGPWIWASVAIFA